MNDVLVSIICCTYNHEDYIADAIESFLMQKTNFKYEILIHDDASTDKTTDIIKKYTKKYPDLIKPIYQIENQYSKGVKVDYLNSKRALGKYIATCEGDDYWTDPYKLQKQIDYLESNAECVLCVHAAKKIDITSKEIVGEVRPCNQNKIFSVEEIIEGGGGLFATNSMVYRRKVNEPRPRFYMDCHVGDYPMMIYLAICGKVYYMDEFMSAYRVGVEGSWTNRTFMCTERIINHYKNINQMLDNVNDYTKGKYETVIKRTKLRNEFKILMSLGCYKEVKTGEYKIFYDKLSKTEKVKIFMKQHFPNIIKILKHVKGSIGYGHCNK